MYQNNIIPCGQDSEDRRPQMPPDRKAHSTINRRQLITALGGGAAASVGMAGRGSGQESPVVMMGNTYFDPIGLFVEPETTVRFEISEGAHSATAYEDRVPAAATPFDSGTLSDEAFEHTFDVAGTYDYYCSPHQSTQVGRIIVGEPGGPAEESTIPHSSVPESERIRSEGAVSIDEFEGGSRDSGGMMGGMEPGMHHGDGTNWPVLLPLGFATAVLVAAGAIYAVTSRSVSADRQQSPAMTILREQYARGEIDEKEFQKRHARLQREE